MKIIKQRDFSDCGVTCLGYLIQYYGGYVPIETLRQDTFTDHNGTTAFHLVETLKKYGFDSFGQKISLDRLKDMVLPCIVHFILPNGLQHFVILEKVRKKEVVLMDPAYGKRKYSFEEFSALWDGVVLLAIPHTKILKLPKEKSVLDHLLPYIKRESWLILSIVFFTLITSFLSIITSFYIKIGINKVEVFALKELYLFLFFFAILSLFKLVFEYLKQYFTIYLDKNIAVSSMYSFLTHFFRLPYQKFSTYHEGDILTRVEEAGQIKDLFHQVCITFFLESFLGIGSCFVLFFLHSKLGMLVLLGMLFYLLIGIFTAKSFYRLVLKHMEVETKWNESLLEAIRIFPTVKHLHQEAFQLETIENSLCEASLDRQAISKRALVLQVLKTNFMELFFFGLTSYGILLIGRHELSVLDFITFQSLYVYFVTPIKEIMDIGPKFYYMKGVFQKLSETMNLKEEELKPIVSNVPITRIQVQDLSFTYHQVQPIFEHLSFEIQAREHVFFSGASGCGKSTFCKILIGELIDYQGVILLDSKNIKDYELSLLRSSLVYLSQGENLMAGTIKENILFGRPETERFSQILALCEIESIVSHKPFRYETTIANDTLSGGERQRIMLARTLMQEGSIYILDECLSEVEKSLELKIIARLHEFLKEKTLIYISHTDYSAYFERSIYFESQNNLE